MTTPIVTELPLRLEPITRDSFIDGLAEPVAVAAFLPAPAAARRPVTQPCAAVRPSGAAAWSATLRIREARDPIELRRLVRHGRTS